MPLLALCGCFDDGTSGGGEPDFTFRQTYSYSVSGNRLISGGGVDTNYYCEGSEVRMETEPIELDSLEFSVQGNVFTLYEDTVGTGYGDRFQWFTTATRSGSGSGLEGTWTLTGADYRVTSGALSVEGKAELDSDLARQRRSMSYTHVDYFFSGTSLIVSGDSRTAARFVDDWYGDGAFAEGKSHDVTVKALDKYTVELKGDRSGEVVTVSIHPNGDRTYTSSRSDHPRFQYLSNGKPATCPIDLPWRPKWYEDFLFDNVKPGQPLGKSGEIRLKKGSKGKAPSFPLKTLYSLLNYPT